MSVPVLDLQGVAFAYPDGHQALHGVDLHVHQGERVALLGPNGAGKTTLVLHLNGILMPGLGSVAISGLPVAKDNLLEIRRRVGIVFQDPDDQLFMGSVRDDVAFGPMNLGLRGPELDRRVHGGAGGRRHGGVRRPPAAPPLLRPAPPGRRRHGARDAAGDPGARRAVVQPRPGLAPRAGRDPDARSTSPSLLVTHDLPYALELCPRSVILSDGVVVADGPTADILADEELMAAHRLELPFGFDRAVECEERTLGVRLGQVEQATRPRHRSHQRVETR